jgi:hypothetical protein
MLWSATARQVHVIERPLPDDTELNHIAWIAVPTGAGAGRGSRADFCADAALTLTLSQRERGPTEVFERGTPTCNTESNSNLEKLPNRLPFSESNSDLEKPGDRLPFPSPPGGEGWGEGEKIYTTPQKPSGNPNKKRP